MEKTYVTLAIWLVLGIVIGTGVYFLFLAPKTEVIPETIQLPTLNNTLTGTETPIGITSDNVDVVAIFATDCSKCQPLEPLLDQLNGLLGQVNLSAGKIERYDWKTPEAKTLMQKYNITKVPTLLLTFKAQRNQQLADYWVQQIGSSESNGVLILRNVYPPYFNTLKNKTVGLINAIGIDAENCPQCMNSTGFFNTLEGQGFAMTFQEKQIINESQAGELITKYNITKLPTFILDEQTYEYPAFVKNIAPMGSTIDGSFVFRNILPPYKDLRNNTITGLVSVIQLVNSSCVNCLNISAFTSYLSNAIGISLTNTTTYELDSTAGKTLITKYNVSRIPTLILSKEAADYDGFGSAWEKEGNTIEKDGSFVFRTQNATGFPYQNLTG